MSRNIILPGGDTLKLFDSAYPPSEVEAILTKALRQPRRNLLRNARWDVLANIVNQRGLIEYAIEGTNVYIYTIDNWMIFYYGLTVTLTEQALHIVSPATFEFRQRIDYLTSVIKLLAGYPITLSFLTNYGLTSLTHTISGTEDSTFFVAGNQVHNSYAVIRGQNNFLNAELRADSAEDIYVIAAKLELGPDQTLAHQDANGSWVLNDPPPDFGLELLKCQRYFQTFATQSQRPTKGADFRPVMRTENPTLGTITLPDGTVLYTASSEL